VDEDRVFDRDNFSERLELMMDFSNTVREFRRTFLDEKSIFYIEHVCSVYDTVNLKHKLDNEALRRLVEKLKEDIESYKSCLTS